jgi:Holliday junction resolvase-like predicted endonuclease
MFHNHHSEHGLKAERHVAAWLEDKGWTLERELAGKSSGADLVVRQGDQLYVVEVKSLSEGRPDRVIPLLSQAVLQAQAYAAQEPNAKPLAVAYVEHASPSLLRQVANFVERYVHHAGVGVVSANGLSLLRQAPGGAVEINDADQPTQRRLRSRKSSSSSAINLFSDLNQWMLKVLLAPDIPEELLNAPRNRYYSGAELASAAQVSTMSASRFLKQLQNERFLDESAAHIVLVRREDLFIRWRAATMRSYQEMPMRLLIKAGAQQQIRRFVSEQNGQACIGLFGAADGLGLGHVSGVPPYVYMPRLPSPGIADGGLNAMVAYPEGAPDFIIRQASSPRSTFQGAVHRDGAVFADVIQVWIEVSNHPSRGQEQADFIYQKVLQQVIDAGR